MWILFWISNPTCICYCILWHGFNPSESIINSMGKVKFNPDFSPSGLEAKESGWLKIRSQAVRKKYTLLFVQFLTWRMGSGSESVSCFYAFSWLSNEIICFCLYKLNLDDVNEFKMCRHAIYCFDSSPRHYLSRSTIMFGGLVRYWNAGNVVLKCW